MRISKKNILIIITIAAFISIVLISSKGDLKSRIWNLAWILLVVSFLLPVVRYLYREYNRIENTNRNKIIYDELIELLDDFIEKEANIIEITNYFFNKYKILPSLSKLLYVKRYSEIYIKDNEEFYDNIINAANLNIEVNPVEHFKNLDFNSDVFFINDKFRLIEITEKLHLEKEVDLELEAGNTCSVAVILTEKYIYILKGLNFFSNLKSADYVTYINIVSEITGVFLSGIADSINSILSKSNDLFSRFSDKIIINEDIIKDVNRSIENSGSICIPITNFNSFQSIETENGIQNMPFLTFKYNERVYALEYYEGDILASYEICKYLLQTTNFIKILNGVMKKYQYATKKC